MIELLIFHLLICYAVYAFAKNWQRRSFRDGLLAIAILGLIFTISWALTSPIAYWIMPDKWVSLYFSKDTLSLCLLFVPISVFFYLFFVRDRELKDNK